MSRRRRSTNAKASTSEAGEDRADARDPQTPAGSTTETTTPSEGSDSEAEQDAGGSTAEEKQLENSSTKAGAKVVEEDFESRPAPRTFAQCPRCGERRFSPDLVGKTVTCPNCRTGQKLV